MHSVSRDRRLYKAYVLLDVNVSVERLWQDQEGCMCLSVHVEGCPWGVERFRNRTNQTCAVLASTLENILRYANAPRYTSSVQYPIEPRVWVKALQVGGGNPRGIC